MYSLQKRLALLRYPRSSFLASVSLAIVGSMLIGGSAGAALTENLDSATLEETYLLDSDEGDVDPTTNRHTVRTEFEAFIGISNVDPDYDGTYRVAYSLKNDSGVYELLSNGDTNHPILPKRIAYTDSQSVKLSIGLFNRSDTLLFEALPDPLKALNSKDSYSVEGTLQIRTSADRVVPEVWEDVLDAGNPEMESTTPEKLLHFTNTVSGDAEFNVRAGITRVDWAKTYALNTDSDDDAFVVKMAYFASRWDGFDASLSTETVAFTVDFDLIDAFTNASIPLENDGIAEFTMDFESHEPGADPSPEPRQTGNETVLLKPLQQLESATKTYILRCTISHEEDGIGTEFVDSSCDLAPEPLYHFNGNLKFGSLLTQFHEISNTPATLPGSATTFRNTSIQVPADQGSFPNHPDYAFGDNGLLTVRLLNNGDAVLYGAGTQAVYVPGVPATTLHCDYGDTRIEYGGITLSTSGAVANSMKVLFPQGMTLMPDADANAFLGESSIEQASPASLDSTLCPVSDLMFTLGANAAVADESHPLVYRVTQLDVSRGKFTFITTEVDYIHDQAFADLEDLVTTENIPPEMADRCSNDRYLYNVQPSDSNLTLCFSADSGDGTSRISTEVITDPNVFKPHFPHRSEVVNTLNSYFVLQDGVTLGGIALEGTTDVSVHYYQTCPEDDCTADLGPIKVDQEPGNDVLYFTPGGGLHGLGSISSGNGALKWGQRDVGVFAHETDEFGEGSFYMPGYQLYSTANTLRATQPYVAEASDNSAAALLLSAFDPDLNDSQLILAPDKEYIDGLGDLPGLTFEVTGSNFGGLSRLGGSPKYEYTLLEDQGSGGSKYYIRLAGVSGRQIGENGTYDPVIELHGFPAELTQFQLSFLDSDNTVPGTDSWVDGSIQTVGPYSEWQQRFTGLKFDCLGEPGDMKPDLSDADGKNLTYWNSEFDLKTIRFETEEINPGACPKQFVAKLVVGAKTRVAHIDKDLYGLLAFCPDGNLSTLDSQIAGVDSQLRIPANIPLTGPNKDYNFVTTSKLRFNNPTAPGAPEEGFVTFAGTIDIPYFIDLQVQAITSATPGAFANFYLTPGWADASGDTFFNQINFDPTHRGFPPASSGIDFWEYRSPGEGTDKIFLIKAEQKLFNLIDLEYPLRWDDNVRRFASMTSQKQELFVTQVEHEVEWMDAKFANISFGAKYDGLPQLKLSNYLNDQIDEAANIITSEFNSLAKQAVDLAIEKMNKLLDDSLESLIDPVVDAAADGPDSPIAKVYQMIEALEGSSNDYADFRMQVHDILNAPGTDPYNHNFRDPILDELRKMGATADETQSFIVELDDTLQKVILGIDAIIQGVNIQGGIPDFSVALPSSPDIPGLLYKSGGKRDIVKNVIKALLRDYVGPDLAAVIGPLIDAPSSALKEELDALLPNLDMTLDQIREVLLQVRGVLVEVQGQFDEVNGVFAQIQTIIEDAESSLLLGGIIESAGQRAWNHFLSLEAALGINELAGTDEDISDLVASLSSQEFTALIKAGIKVGIMESDIVTEIQFVMRHTLYDVQDKVTSAVQSVLAEMSNVIKELISKTVGELEEQLNPLLGKVSDFMGSGEISGYAEVNGDSLRKLRLDAKMQFSLPDEMALHVYLEILSYSSEDNFVESGCIQPGEKAVEVRIGAKDVKVEWLSDIQINLEVKMSLKSGPSKPFPLPNGVGGMFEMTGGTLDFQSFEVLEFGATIAVGFDEAYIGARTRARFSGYEVAAGIFFGRTCTLEPLLFVDPDIGEVVDAGTTFTGVYVYGEVWLPISELVLGVPASCLFRIDAGVGAGAFYFVEGATYGGKIFLGISGEALCLVSIRGDVKMILASQAGTMRGSGTGKFSAKVGWCPFCIKFRKSVKIKYDNGGWGID